MKKLFSLFPLFLFLLIPAFSENTNALPENSSVQILETSNISSTDFYARRSSSRSRYSSRNSTSKDKKTDDKKSSFGGMGGLITGLIGGALLGSLLSGMGFEGLAEFAGILMWGALGLLAFFLIRSFLAKKKKNDEMQQDQGFSNNF